MTSGRDGSGTCKKVRVPGRVGTGSKKILKAKSTYIWEINVRQIIIIANGINSKTQKLQTALAWKIDELERNQKKENNLNMISKMMGTLVHAQLYTFSYRKAVIRPQNMPKTADWG